MQQLWHVISKNRLVLKEHNRCMSIFYIIFLSVIVKSGNESYKPISEYDQSFVDIKVAK